MEPPTPPQSREEANAQLERLLQKRGASTVQIQGFAGEQLREALKILSDQLYSKPTHFILELLQNADDNDYSAVVKQNLRPSFSISLKALIGADGKKFYGLETGCNENGFSLQQIDALCSIGKSTKKSAKDVHSGYIGEKGIGFKSVFKVASAVHISSGFYHFKLNKTEDMLGVLLPLPSSVIQESHRTETTRMRLWISDRQDHGRIAKDLRKIKPEILLFLRRLRRIVVHVGTEEAEYQATYTSHDEELQGEVRSVAVSRSTAEAKKGTKYIIVRGTVNEMPTEPKRENIHYSEVTLAFPVEPNGSPITREQQIFAYLPVGDYGFRFLIQSDFILLADRERLPASNAWNNKLRGAIVSAFVDAVERFNRIDGPLRYSWPQYLVRTLSRDAFWDGLDHLLVRRLQYHPVLQSRANGLQEPSGMIFIPPAFSLDGVPLIDSPKQRDRHLVADYVPELGTGDSTAVRLPPGLLRLGVRAMDQDLFVSEFCDWGSREQPDLGSRSPEWHSKISTNIVNSYRERGRLRHLPIVPTTEGGFAPASMGNLYLGSQDVVRGAPKGLGLVFVDAKARGDPNREALFRWLQVPELKAGEVCELILRDHRTKNQRQEPRSPDCYVEEMVYLFLHRRLLANLSEQNIQRNLWVVTKDRELSRARFVYCLDSDASPNLVSRHASKPAASITLLHPDYFERASYMHSTTDSPATEDTMASATTTADVRSEDICPESAEASAALIPARKTHPFIQWLASSCGIALLPRLTVVKARDAEGKLKTVSRECRWLIANDPKEFILLLRDHLLKDYLSDIQDIAMVVRKMPILCQDGQIRELKGTAIPSKALLESCPHLAFGNFPDPENRNWVCFSSFSVVTEVNDTAHMQELREIRLLDVNENTLEAVGRIYTFMSDNSHKVKKSILDTFLSAEKVVFHPRGGWVPLSACVWESPSCLQNTLALAEYYPKCANFFQRKLGVKNAGITQLVDELDRLHYMPDSSRDHPLLKEIILTLSAHSKQVQPGRESDDVLQGIVKFLKVFPVISTAKSLGESPNTVYKSIGEDWYIADRGVLRRTFIGKLSLDKKLLSKAVEQRTTYLGSPIYNRGWSNDIQKRAKCLALLGTNTDMKLPLFEVSLAPGLNVERTIGDIRGETEDGHVSIAEGDDLVKIVVLKDPVKHSNLQVDRELASFFIRLYAIMDVSRILLVSSILKADFGDVQDLLEGANIRASLEDVNFCVDGDDEHAAPEDGGMAGLNAAARGVIKQLSLGLPRFLTHATDYGPRIYTSAQRDLPSRFKEIGLKAEIHVNNFFQQHLPDWMPEKHWTSHLREEKGHSVFLGDESTTADFTYTDTEGKILQTIEVVRESWSSHTITYHIEVKGTVCEFEEPFHFSQNQMNLARKYAFKHGKIPSDVFLIGRVYNVEKEKPGLKFYWNPWEMINEGSLVMTVGDGYRIAPGDTGAASKAA
ncbi:hypothetical protein CNYM01_06505 [Colletotrichum nymphaeae SA-01]|uniref:Protein NO VEIN C-terminal domain-containing protein n=1 Tax=Colletotrichum nymphaeae SA-01 TaxID=1460502 RepID=A0A135S3X5_9PEZI|nr:hypothetical protein CNYM01_06505 [Colletotrichum nymphaeae SA-01]